MARFTDTILNNLDIKVAQQFGEVQPIQARPPETYFEALCESIVSQQLSVKVADIIFTRLKNQLHTEFTPKNILIQTHETLRSVGLSNAKANYIKNIAEAWETSLINSNKLISMSDSDVIDYLVQIKGVGKWTAEMFLIFTLGRLDVFSAGDYGLRKGISLAYDIPLTSKPAVFNDLALQWSPNRSFASRILWKSLDLPQQ